MSRDGTNTPQPRMTQRRSEVLEMLSLFGEAAFIHRRRRLWLKRQQRWIEFSQWRMATSMEFNYKSDKQTTDCTSVVKDMRTLGWVFIRGTDYNDGAWFDPDVRHIKITNFGRYALEEFKLRGR